MGWIIKKPLLLLQKLNNKNSSHLCVNLGWKLEPLDVINGFLEQSNGDHALFIKHRNNKIFALIVYVGDIIITGDDVGEIASLKIQLSKEFEMKELGQLRYFLGIEVAKSEERIMLLQQKYVMGLLTETGMLGCKPANTPIGINQQLCIYEGEPVNKERYQKLVVKLIYLSSTRPDITFAGNLVSQYMHDPKQHILKQFIGS